MRTVNQLPVGTPKNPDSANYPDGGIINKGPTTPGTPVVEEIIGDPLENIYKILRTVGMTPNGEADNETNGYQLRDALQRLPNVLNDVEQPMNLASTVWSVNIDLNFLPSKYFLFVKAAEDYNSALTYTFKGSTGSPVYNFTAIQSFAAGDELLLILDADGVRAFNLSAIGSDLVDVFTPFGTPLAFNNGKKVWYQEQGVIFSDKPELFDLQSPIRVLQSDGTLLVYEILMVGGFVLCLGFSVATSTYKLYQYSVSDLATPSITVTSDGPFTSGVDNKPYMYTDGTKLYISNSANDGPEDYQFIEYTLDLASNVATRTGSISLDTGFVKTTNAVVHNNFLYTFVGGILNKYDLTTGVVTLVGSFPTYLGVLFKLNGAPYYSNGDVAKLWTI